MKQTKGAAARADKWVASLRNLQKRGRIDGELSERILTHSILADNLRDSNSLKVAFYPLYTEGHPLLRDAKFGQYDFEEDKSLLLIGVLDNGHIFYAVAYQETSALRPRVFPSDWPGETTAGRHPSLLN